MKNIWFVGLAVWLGLAGCKKGEEGAKPGEATAKGGGDKLDPQEEVKALQGTWQVKDTLSQTSTWMVQGDRITRKRGENTEEGKLEFPAPGLIAIVTESGGGTSREYYGYTRNGADLYLGLGKAGRKLGGTLQLAADDGLVVSDATGCRFFKKDLFEGYAKSGVEVKCELAKDEGGKEIFAYEVPDAFKPGQMAKKEAFVVGTALLDAQMMGNKVVK